MGLPQPFDARGLRPLRVSCLPQIAGSAPSSLRARPLRVTPHSLTSTSLRPARGLAGGRLRARWGRPSLPSLERLRSASRLERFRFAAQLPLKMERTAFRDVDSAQSGVLRIGTCT